MKGTGRTILVVDDHPDIRDGYRALLEDYGFRVETVGSGDEALAAIRRAPPDLILTDIVMPGMDGFQLLAQLQAEFGPAAPPAIVCSGFDITEQEALRLGARHFIPKPVDPEILAWALDLFLEGLRIGPALDAQSPARAHTGRELAASRENAAAAMVDGVALAAKAMQGLEWLRTYLDCASAAVFIVKGRELELVAGHGGPVATGAGPVGGALLELFQAVLQTGSSLVISDVAVHPCFRPIGAAPNVRMLVTVPLSRPDARVPVGLLCVADEQPRRFEAEDLAIVEHFARRSGLLVGGASAKAARRTEPVFDSPLILTERTFERLFALELGLASRLDVEMEMAVLDLAEGIDSTVSAQRLTQTLPGQRTAIGHLDTTRIAAFTRAPPSPRPRPAHALSLAEAVAHLGDFKTAAVVDVAGPRVPRLPAPALLRMAADVVDAARSGRDRVVEQITLRVEPNVEERP